MKYFMRTCISSCNSKNRICKSVWCEVSLGVRIAKSLGVNEDLVWGSERALV